MSSYRAYKPKLKEYKNSEARAGDVYKSVWFTYATLDAFLKKLENYKDTKNTVGINNFYVYITDYKNIWQSYLEFGLLQEGTF